MFGREGRRQGNRQAIQAFGVQLYIHEIPQIRSYREKGMVQSISQSRRRDTYSGFHILRFHGKGKGKGIARTLFGIRTAQSSRFESPSTVFQLNLSFSRISVKGWKPLGVGGSLQHNWESKKKGVWSGLVWLAMKESGIRDSTGHGL